MAERKRGPLIGLIIFNLVAVGAILLIWFWPHVTRLFGPGQTDVQALHDAVRSGDIEATRSLLDRGVNANALDPDFGATPLHGAASRGHAEIVRLLLQRGAGPDAVMESTAYTPLYWAVENGHGEAAKALLEGGADPNKPSEHGNAPLHIAAADPQMLALLLDHGADIETRNDLGQTVLNARGCYERQTLNLLLERGADPNSRDQLGRTALHSIALPVSALVDERDSRDEMLSCADLLLEHGADMNARDENGNTPVFYCLMEGEWRGVAMFRRRGADLQVRNDNGFSLMHAAAASPLHAFGYGFGGDSRIGTVEYLQGAGLPIDEPDNSGMTPLHWASYWGNADLLAYLLDQGADIHNRFGRGATVLVAACNQTDPPIHQRIASVEILLERGADIHASGETGNTALHVAASFGLDDVVELLLESGADPALQNAEGLTPAAQAESEGHAELVDRLRQAAHDLANGADNEGSAVEP